MGCLSKIAFVYVETKFFYYEDDQVQVAQGGLKTLLGDSQKPHGHAWSWATRGPCKLQPFCGSIKVDLSSVQLQACLLVEKGLFKFKKNSKLLKPSIK